DRELASREECLLQHTRNGEPRQYDQRRHLHHQHIWRKNPLGGQGKGHYYGRLVNPYRVDFWIYVELGLFGRSRSLWRQLVLGVPEQRRYCVQEHQGL